MNFYLDDWETFVDPDSRRLTRRPAGVGDLGFFSCIDLRDFCLVATRDPIVNAKADLVLTQGPREKLGDATRRIFSRRMALDLEEGIEDAGEALFEWYSRNATPTGDRSRWSPIQEGWLDRGRTPGIYQRGLQLVFGGQVWWQQPTRQARWGTVIMQDGFSGSADANLNGRTPDTTNTPGNTWVGDPTTGGLQLDGSGRVKWATSGDSARYNVATADHNVSLIYNAGNADNRMSLYARSNNFKHNDGDNMESYYINTQPAVPKTTFARRNAGESDTTFATDLTDYDENADLKIEIECSGTTITAQMNDSTPTGFSVTDGDVTGTYVQWQGALRTTANGRFEDAIVDNLAAAAGFVPFPQPRGLTGGGMQMTGGLQ